MPLFKVGGAFSSPSGDEEEDKCDVMTAPVGREGFKKGLMDELRADTDTLRLANIRRVCRRVCRLAIDPPSSRNNERPHEPANNRSTRNSLF